MKNKFRCSRTFRILKTTAVKNVYCSKEQFIDVATKPTKHFWTGIFTVWKKNGSRFDSNLGSLPSQAYSLPLGWMCKRQYKIWIHYELRYHQDSNASCGQSCLLETKSINRLQYLCLSQGWLFATIQAMRQNQLFFLFFFLKF